MNGFVIILKVSLVMGLLFDDFWINFFFVLGWMFLIEGILIGDGR